MSETRLTRSSHVHPLQKSREVEKFLLRIKELFDCLCLTCNTFSEFVIVGTERLSLRFIAMTTVLSITCFLLLQRCNANIKHCAHKHPYECYLVVKCI